MGELYTKKEIKKHIEKGEKAYGRYAAGHYLGAIAKMMYNNGVWERG